MNVLNRSTLKLKNNLPYFEIPEFANLGWVRHVFLTRRGGVSLSPYDSLNLSNRNGDLEKFVLQNKNMVAKAFGFESRRLVLLDQMQRDQILILKEPISTLPPPLEYDALITDSTYTYLGIQAADCLPILMVDQKKKVIAAVHAWKAGNGSTHYSQGYRKDKGGIRLLIKRLPHRYRAVHRILLL